MIHSLPETLLRYATILALMVVMLGTANDVSATPIGRTIIIDGVITDWYTAPAIPSNPGQFSTDLDGTVNPGDKDFLVQATGRDLKHFSYTWDNVNLYVYVERYASTSNHNDWWFYLDLNNNGLMEVTDRVFRVNWQGANATVNRELWNYSPLVVVGDPLTDIYGSGDGYDMPGTINNRVTLSSGGPGGSAAGVEMESYVPWAILGLAGPTSIGFHISSSNGTNLPNQLDDNMDGPGGGAGGGSGLVFLDLAVTKVASGATIVGGATFTYTLTITNNGGGNASGVNLTDILPAGITYVSDNSATTGTSYNAVSGLWTVGSVLNNTAISLVITATAQAVVAVTNITNTTSALNLNEADTNTANNTASVAISVRPAPDLAVVKSHVGFFNEGQNGIYTIQVNNVGTGYDDGIKTITDVLPVGLNYITFIGTGWNCSAAGQNLSCTNSDYLAVGAALSPLYIYVTPDVNAIPSVSNTATISSTNFDTNTLNNSATDIATVIPSGTQMCYAIGDSGNVLTMIDTSDINPVTNEVTIGSTGVNNINALAYDCTTATLYAVNGGVFGSIDRATGAFSAIGTIGSGSGALGSVNFNNISGLAFDKSTGTLYASHATGGGNTDVLFQINRSTGAAVPHAFDPGVDYVTIGNISDISDIAIDQTTGNLYGVNFASTPDQLVQINTSTGATTLLPNNLGMDNMVGLGSDGAGGLWGTTQTSQQIYAVSPTSGSAAGARTINNDNNYVAVDCVLNCLQKQADVGITKTVSTTTPIELQQITFTLTATNYGPDQATTVIVSDALPAGLTFVSSSPSQGSYDAASGIWHVGTINNGGNATLSIVATVDSGTSGSTIINSTSVNYVTQLDSNASNNTASVAVTPVSSDLSLSYKTAVDLNGGALEPGDIIEYSIFLVESTGITTTNVLLEDSIAAGLGNLTVTSLPAGAVDNSTTTGGVNGTGFLSIASITVAGGSTATVIFHATVAAATLNGTVISNTATITNPSGPGATPVGSPVMIVTGNPETKQLYFDHLNNLSRTMSNDTIAVSLPKNGTVNWTMTPASVLPIVLSSSKSIAVPVWITNGNNSNINVTATLSYSGGSAGTIDVPSVISIAKNTTARYTFSFTPAANITLASNTVIALNLSNGSNSKGLTVLPFNAGTHSQVDLNVASFIKVEQVDFYTSAYPAGTPISQVIPGTTVYVRALVSDPFGNFDISATSLEIIDPVFSSPVGPGAAMTMVDNATAGYKTFEFNYTIPVAASTGNWQALVTGIEGVEGVSHTGVGVLQVGYPPNLTIVKSSNTALASPGAAIIYTIHVENTGLGMAHNVMLDDHFSPYTAFGLNTYGAGVPFQLTQGSPVSSLTMGTATYSNDNGVTYLYTPTSGGGAAPAGYDGNMTNWKLPMTGIMNAGGKFDIQYKMVVE